MAEVRNQLGQPIGWPLGAWTAPSAPPHEPIAGRWCRLEPLEARHAVSLFEANRADADGRIWTYLPYGPFASEGAYRAWVDEQAPRADPMFFAVVDKESGAAAGVLSYLRIDPAHGVIEIGHICFSPRLQRTRAATEAVYQLMRRAFQLGYRRVEWKCDALNQPSREAAGRFGFRFEGVFRQATIYKGRNRDTAWFSVIDAEWPALDEAFGRWLDPVNFDGAGRQLTSLRRLTGAAAFV